jgi:hypothetical protein
MGEINWLTELRKIEREFDGLPPEPTPTELRARRAAEQRADSLRKQRATVFGVLGRLTLVVALAGAIVLWPYHRECGTGLFLYMSAEGVIVVGGLWLVACTWRARMAKTHGAALILVLWGLTADRAPDPSACRLREDEGSRAGRVVVRTRQSLTRLSHPSLFNDLGTPMRPEAGQFSQVRHLRRRGVRMLRMPLINRVAPGSVSSGSPTSRGVW